MTIAETFENMQANFNPSAAVNLNKTIQVNLSGDEGGNWALIIANQTCELIAGGVDKSDLMLNMSDQNWLAVNERRLNPMAGFMAGKIKICGDMSLAMRLPNLFNWK